MYNGKLREWVKKEQWKCEHIDLFGIVQTTTGKRKNHYNYQSGFTKRIWDAMLDDLIKNGIRQGDIPKILSSCGLTIKSIERKMSGHEETHLYEMEQILLAANYTIQFDAAEKEIFRVTRKYPIYQVSEEMDRVIIKRNLYPKMHINFNPNDLKDMEIDFGKEKIISNIGIIKMVSYVLPAMLQYFNSKDKKTITKLTTAIKTEVKRQYLNEEILITNKKRS